MTPADVVAQARTWLGVRWAHQGRSREGVDCVGLPIKVVHELGLRDGDKTDYARQATDESMLQLCREHMVEVPKAEMQLGDIVVIPFQNQRHMAIVGDYPWGGGLSLIHAYAQSRKVVEHRLDEIWQARIIGVFRFQEFM